MGNNELAQKTMLGFLWRLFFDISCYGLALFGMNGNQLLQASCTQVTIAIQSEVCCVTSCDIHAAQACLFIHDECKTNWQISDWDNDFSNQRNMPIQKSVKQLNYLNSLLDSKPHWIRSTVLSWQFCAHNQFVKIETRTMDVHAGTMTEVCNRRAATDSIITIY